MIDYNGMLKNVPDEFHSNDEPMRHASLLFTVVRSLKTVSEFAEFFSAAADKNIFIAALLLKKAEDYYSEDEPVAQTGRKLLSSKLEAFSLGSGEHSHFEIGCDLLAEIILRTEYHVRNLCWHLSNRKLLMKYLPYLQCLGEEYADCVLHLLSLFSESKRHSELYKRLRLDFPEFLYTIDVSYAKNKELLGKLIGQAMAGGDIVALIELNKMFSGFSFFEEAHMTRDEMREYLSNNQQRPHSMYLYIKCLEKEKERPGEILKEAYCFTSWSTGRSEDELNDYLYFAYAVNSFPEDFERYAGMLAGREYSPKPEENNGEAIVYLSPERELIENAFCMMILKKPDKAYDFIKTAAPISIYSPNRSLFFRPRRIRFADGCTSKNVRWALRERYLNSNEKALDFYFSSPLKAIIDIKWLIRQLQDRSGLTMDLNNALNDFSLPGVVRIDENAEYNKRFKVTPLSFYSPDGFYFDKKWMMENYGTVQNLKQWNIVYFRIRCYASISHPESCSIYAYDVYPAEFALKNAENTICSKAFSPIPVFMDSFADKWTETLLFSAAWIENDKNEILVDRSDEDGAICDRLPNLLIHYRLTSRSALYLLLEEKLGYRVFSESTLIGIRQVILDENKRAVFFIYKVRLEKYDEHLFKPYMVWRDKEDFLNNIDVSDGYSFRFFQNLDTESGFSEAIITVEDTMPEGEEKDDLSEE